MAASSAVSWGIVPLVRPNGKAGPPAKDSIPGISDPPVGLITGRQAHFGA